MIFQTFQVDYAFEYIMKIFLQKIQKKVDIFIAYSFRENKKLQWINLGYNNLKRLPNETFKNQTVLEKLLIYNNPRLTHPIDTSGLPETVDIKPESGVYYSLNGYNVNFSRIQNRLT